MIFQVVVYNAENTVLCRSEVFEDWSSDNPNVSENVRKFLEVYADTLYVGDYVRVQEVE